MPFFLSRGGKNIPAEVQRWQYFLLKRGYNQAGKIDADFGEKTETGTRLFQAAQQLKLTGRLDKTTMDAARSLGYTVLPELTGRLRPMRGRPACANTLATVP